MTVITKIIDNALINMESCDGGDSGGIFWSF